MSSHNVGGDSVVDVNSLVRSIDEKLKKVSQVPPDWTIFRVPSRLRKLTPDAYKVYTPQLVAIGPAHLKQRGFPFQAMEEQKLVYMQSLLKRTAADSLASCAKAVLEMEKEWRSSYADPADRDYKNLVEILLVDACFTLELLIKHQRGEKEGPVFCNAWMLLTLQRDMSLMENQIPFPLLETVFDKLLGPKFGERHLKGVSLIDLAINFFSSAWNLKETKGLGIKKCEHFLDLLLQCYLPQSATNREIKSKPNFISRLSDKCNCLVNLSQNNAQSSTQGRRKAEQSDNSDLANPEIKSKPNFISRLSDKCKCLVNLSQNNAESSTQGPRKTDWELLHTALELSAAGIEFKKAKSYNIFDVEYKGSVLKIPQFRIDDLTETLLKNLIAYEQCCTGSRHLITSYVVFMDRLINSWQDVRFLEKKQILTHIQGNSGHVSRLFNNICNEVVLNDDFFFADVCAKIHKRYNSNWLKRLAVLKRDYFPNLWKVMAFVAAFMLLAFTSLQTVYSILSYY